MFSDSTQEDLSRKNRAETYLKIYQWAAEDFVTLQDFTQLFKQFEEYKKSVDAQLESLFSLISSHTHDVTPHTHICTAPGAPATPTSVVTLPPKNSNSIVYNSILLPKYINTTAVQPNLDGSSVIPSTSEGSSDFVRKKPIDIATAPTIPPVITDSLKAGI